MCESIKIDSIEKSKRNSKYVVEAIIMGKSNKSNALLWKQNFVVDSLGMGKAKNNIK